MMPSLPFVVQINTFIEFLILSAHKYAELCKMLLAAMFQLDVW